MIEKEQDYEKEIVERVKREIKEESKKNKGRTLRMMGLIISGVGGLLYFIIGFIFLFASIGYMLWVTIPLLIAGAISQTGTLVAISKVKIGGVFILTSIPISLVIGILVSLTQSYPYYYPSFYNMVMVFQLILYPIPIPHSVHVIVGGILCLTASDKKVREY